MEIQTFTIQHSDLIFLFLFCCILGPFWASSLFNRERPEARPNPSGHSGLQLVSDLLEPANEAVGGIGGVGTIEVRGPEFTPLGAVAQHVPGGSEHGSGHADDCLLGTPPGPQAAELSLQVAALDLDGGPGGLLRGGLEPGCTPVPASAKSWTRGGTRSTSTAGC